MRRKGAAAGEHAPGEGAAPGVVASMESLGPRVFLATLRGYLDADAARALSAELERRIAASAEPLHVYWDLSAVTNYHSDVRVELTRVFAANRPKVASVVVLTQSKLVTMGVAVANLALGGLVRPVKTRAEFETLIAQARVGVAPARR